MIFNIQRFSTHDGEGIRTIIFFKGCPLRCQWCSNPESQSFEPEIMFDRLLCKKFRECMKTAPHAITLAENGINIDRSAIRDPGPLSETCLTRALTVAGKNYSMEEITGVIEKDLPFYRQSNGGVTLSGGEPLAQGAGLTVLLTELKKRNIDISIETSLHVSREKLDRSTGLDCTFLVDLKHTHPAKFKEFTGGNIRLVLTNLKHLVHRHEKIIIRIPVIPRFNHTNAEMNQIIDYIFSLKQIREIHFIPYHRLGIGKYEMLGKEYKFGSENSVDPAELYGYTEYAHSRGFKTKIGG